MVDKVFFLIGYVVLHSFLLFIILKIVIYLYVKAMTPIYEEEIRQKEEEKEELLNEMKKIYLSWKR